MWFFKKRKKSKVLKFVTPAKERNEAIPCGNGETAIFVEGGAREERIGVLTKGVFVPSTKNACEYSSTVDMKKKVNMIKKEVALGNYAQAEGVLCKTLESEGFEPKFWIEVPLCELCMNFDVFGLPQKYERKIWLNDGLVEVGFEDREGQILRKCFVAQDGTICVKILGLAGKTIDLDLAIQKQDFVLPKDFDEVASKIESSSTVDKNFVCFVMDILGKKFGAVCQVLCSNGSKSQVGQKMCIRGANEVDLFVRTFVQSENADEEISLIKKDLLKNKQTFENLFEKSAPLFAQKMNSSTVELCSQQMKDVESTLLDVKSGKTSIELLQNLFDYGKYLYFSVGKIALESDCLFLDRKQSIPNICTLDQTKEDFFVASQNYLKPLRVLGFLLKGEHLEDVKAFLENEFSKIDAYRKNAKDLFGIDGIFVPSVQSCDSGLLGLATKDVVLNKNLGANICVLIEKYYYSTLDVEFLKQKAFEFLKGVGEFYAEFLKVNKTTDVFESPFGISPFSTPLKSTTMISPNCVVDFASAKFVFCALANLCGIVGDNSGDRWSKLASKVPDLEVDKNGVVKEYNINMFETNNSMPHISHLFPYNLGVRGEKTKRDFETLIANTAKHKFFNSFGNFGARELADMALCLFTCADADDGFEILQTLVRGFVSPNLMFSSADTSNLGLGKKSCKNYFNIDVNTQISSCVQNMFVNSHKNDIFLFNSLPKKIVKAEAKNVVLENGISLDVHINIKRGVAKLKLYSKFNSSINLFVPQTYKRHKGVSVNFDAEQFALTNIDLKPGKPTKLKILFNNL